MCSFSKLITTAEYRRLLYTTANADNRIPQRSTALYGRVLQTTVDYNGVPQNTTANYRRQITATTHYYELPYTTVNYSILPHTGAQDIALTSYCDNLANRRQQLLLF